MAELFQFDTPEVREFQEMYKHADRAPEEIAIARLSIIVN